MINSFTGEYAFLSNFSPISVIYGGIRYQSSEAAYQAQKTTDESLKVKFADLSPGAAKHTGRSIPMRPDWEQVKNGVMYDVCLAKFRQHPEYKQALLDTGDELLVEGNTWGDRYWGVCNGDGKNMLGKTLMRVREKLRKDG